MPRTQRLIINDESTVYHVMSRTALDGFPLGDIEKDFMLDQIRRYAALYLVEILGFCLMGNHFHILVRMFPEYKFTDEDIQKRYVDFYGDERIFSEGLVPSFHCGRNYQVFLSLCVKLRSALQGSTTGATTDGAISGVIASRA